MRHVLLALAVLGPAPLAGAEAPARTHPPVRPLPEASRRALASGSVRYADGKRGNDGEAGSREKPWKTLAHALKNLRPGDTLYLRGGVYHGKHVLSLAGKPDAPITLCSHPGELAVLDGGLGEFLENPGEAWEPVKGGGKGEFRSTKAYPALAKEGRRGVGVLGNFADSLVPLHGYRFVRDFRCDNPYWTVSNKLDDTTGIYCGPGLWFNPDSQRIHVRLAPTRLKLLGKNNYAGEGDPRKVPLVVAGPGGAADREGLARPD